MIINVHKYNEVCILLFIRYFDIGTRTVVFDDHGDCCSRDQYYQHHLFNRVFDYLLQGKEGTKWVIFDIWTDAIIESNSCLKSWLQLWSLVSAKVGANFVWTWFKKYCPDFRWKRQSIFQVKHNLAYILQFKFYAWNIKLKVVNS